MTTLLCTTMQSSVSKQNFETLMIRVRQLDILQQASKDWTDYIFNAVENLIEFRVMPSQRKNKLWSIGGSFEEFSAKKQQTISSSSFYNLEVVSSFKKFRFSPWKRPNLAIFEFGNSISWSVLQRKLLYFFNINLLWGAKRTSLFNLMCFIIATGDFMSTEIVTLSPQCRCKY